MLTNSLILAALLGGICSAGTTQTDTTLTKQTDTTMTKEPIENAVVKGYKVIENGVVKGYKTMENGIVKGFTSVTDTLTSKLFGKEGESVEQTKARLNANVEASRKRSEEILEKS